MDKKKVMGTFKEIGKRMAYVGGGVCIGAICMKLRKDKVIEDNKIEFGEAYEKLCMDHMELENKVMDLQEDIETYKTREEEFNEEIKELSVGPEEMCKRCAEARSL